MGELAAVACFYCDVYLSHRSKRTRSGQMKANAGTIDHIVPQSRLIGGDYPIWDPRWIARNKVDACFSCNNRKGQLWPLQWLIVMPAPGVQRLHDRLLELGCERAEIVEAIALRAVTVALAPV